MSGGKSTSRSTSLPGRSSPRATLAGIRRVLQLQEETRQLQAELARLRDLAAKTATRDARKP
jgi:hypothetical protein